MDEERGGEAPHTQEDTQLRKRLANTQALHKVFDGFARTSKRFKEVARTSWPATVTIIGIVGSVASLYGLYPIIHDQWEARSQAAYARLSDDLHDAFYINVGEPDKILGIAREMRSIKGASEPDLIAVATLTASGRTDAAKAALENAVLPEVDPDRLAIKQLYDLFIALYDTHKKCSPISDVALSRDNKTMFYGKNITRPALLDWVKTFRDPWLVMPAFRESCSVYNDRDLFDFMVRKYPRSAWLYTMRGRAMLERGENGDALADFTTALSIDGRLSDAWYGRARAYEELKKDDLALADYDKAIELDGTRCGPFLDRGVLRNTLKDYDGAIADNSKAIDLCPRKYQAYQNRATWLKQKNRTEDALRDYTFVVAFASDPGQRLAALIDEMATLYQINRKNVACSSDNTDLAMKLVSEVSRRSITFNMLGACNEWSGRYILAITNYLSAWESLAHEAVEVSDLEIVVAKNVVNSLHHFYPNNLHDLLPVRAMLIPVAARMIATGNDTTGIILAGFAADRAQLTELAKGFRARSSGYNKLSFPEKKRILYVTLAVTIAIKSGVLTKEPTASINGDLKDVLSFAAAADVSPVIDKLAKAIAD